MPWLAICLTIAEKKGNRAASPTDSFGEGKSLYLNREKKENRQYKTIKQRNG
jgi:hypothetical protein